MRANPMDAYLKILVSNLHFAVQADPKFSSIFSTAQVERKLFANHELGLSSAVDKNHAITASFCGKRTPTSVRRKSSPVDFRLRNPSSPDVVFVMKALFSILDPQNRVETNTCFVFAHDFVLGVRYCFFFFRCLPLLQTPQNFCDTSFSRMDDYNYNIVTPSRNLSKGGF